MKISQTVDFGQISHTYMSTWKDDNEVELYKLHNKHYHISFARFQDADK